VAALPHSSKLNAQTWHPPALSPPSPQQAASPPRATSRLQHPLPLQALAPLISPHSAQPLQTHRHLQPQTPSDPAPSATAVCLPIATPRGYLSPHRKIPSPAILATFQKPSSIIVTHQPPTTRTNQHA